MPTGVEPIDSAIGGLEPGRAHVLYGEPETGKTTIGLRFVVEGLRRGETCLLVVRYDAEQALVGMTAFGYDPMPDVRSGRLLVYEYATDLVDRLAHVEGLGPLVDELGWMLGGTRPARVVFDTADFIFSIQLGYGTPLQISTLTAWLAQMGATSMLLVDERMATRVVQPFRVHAATVIHATVNRSVSGVEYHLAFEKGAADAPRRRVGLGASEFVTLEVLDTRARSRPEPPARHRYAARDRTGQLTMPDEASRMVAEAAASADAVDAPIPMPPPQPRTAGRSGRPRVLVVDEDAVACRLVARALAPECDIAIEADGIAGLARVGSFDPDLVLIEISLPLVDGFAICRQIREASSVPVMVVTRTHVTPADRVRSAESGADHYLTKPFGLRELAVRARQLVARYRGQPLPIGAALGDLPSDPLVSYDVFLERLVLHAVGAESAIVGCRVGVHGSVETSLVIDVVRGEIRPEDAMAYEPDEHQVVALLPPEGAEDLAGQLSRKVREATGVEIPFWVVPAAKGSAVRALTEQFERSRLGAPGPSAGMRS